MHHAKALLTEAVRDEVFPGACYAVRRGDDVFFGAVGTFTYDQGSSPVTLETIWDLASLSKVIGTTTAVMILVQDGALDLNQTVASVIPEFAVNGKGKITFRNLMVHDSGLVAFRRYHLSYTKASEVMDAIYAEELECETGTKTVYSDLSMILVAEAIERVTGELLDEFLNRRVFEPLGMTNTGYFRHGVPTVALLQRERCAPTEVMEPWRTKLRHERHGIEDAARLYGDNPPYIEGEVHDPAATVLGGVAGHAGLFSNARDLYLFISHMMGRAGEIVRPDIWDGFTRRQSDKSTRALGWDTKSAEGSSAGNLFGPRSFGHTGFTGTSIWCDPDDGKFSILLTNRVCPTSENAKILSFRQRFNSFS